MLLSSSDFGRALKRICWSYVFIYLDLTLFGINVLGDWIGYLLILSAVPILAREERQASLLRPFAIALAAIDGGLAVGELFAAELDPYHLLSVFSTLMWLYLQFQLLTNIAEMAKRRGYPKTNRILALRTWLAVIYSVPFAVAFFFDEKWLAYAFAVLYLILVAWADFVLISLRSYVWENEEELDRMREGEPAPFEH